MTAVKLTGPIESSTSGGWWLTPRRRLERAGPDGERRHIVAARPRIVNPGRAFATTGDIRFEFAPGHPILDLSPAAERVVLVHGFELIVGEEVEVVDEPAVATSG